MVTSLYEEYLYIIGKLKDVHKLDIEVDHKDIHTFYKNKRPVFKLMYGHFEDEASPSLVVSFHIDLFHHEAIHWFIQVYNLHPLIKLHDSWITDDRGEYFLGEEALAIKAFKMEQEILSNWLENHTQEEIKEFSQSKVVGRIRDSKKSFDSHAQKDQAIIEFNRLKTPDDRGEVH